MFNPRRVRSDFNDAATRYDTHARLQQHVMLQLILRLPRLQAGSHVLDAGCGTGAFARTAQHKNVIALDHALRMCMEARNAGSLPVSADMAQLPFGNASFDCVFSSLALQWAADWKKALSEWKRVLKPGGTLAFSTFGAGTLRELAESFRKMDDFTHVSEFIDAQDIWKHMPATVESESVTEYYPDMLTLSRHLKALGASNKHRNARRGLTTPAQLSKVEEHYARHFGTAQGLRVSWNILYVTLQKP